MPEQPPPEARVIALAVSLFSKAGAVNRVAVAMARVVDRIYYLVDDSLVEGPPVWVYEGEIECCFVARLPIRDE